MATDEVTAVRARDMYASILSTFANLEPYGSMFCKSILAVNIGPLGVAIWCASLIGYGAGKLIRDELAMLVRFHYQGSWDDWTANPTIYLIYHHP